MSAHSVTFVPSGRGQAQCEANPDFPNGKSIDISEGKPSCTVAINYPAPECGMQYVKCNACGLSIALTAAGRADDVISVTIPCKKIPTTEH